MTPIYYRRRARSSDALIGILMLAAAFIGLVWLAARQF
jgi:hypothetical protein